MPSDHLIGTVPTLFTHDIQATNNLWGVFRLSNITQWWCSTTMPVGQQYGIVADFSYLHTAVTLTSGMFCHACLYWRSVIASFWHDTALTGRKKEGTRKAGQEKEGEEGRDCALSRCCAGLAELLLLPMD